LKKLFGLILCLLLSHQVCAQQAISHGNSQHHAYVTAIGKNLSRNREVYYVYTPPHYDPAAAAGYPVLYLLHGDKQNAASWSEAGDFDLLLDDLIAKGQVRPMIVVMPEGYGNHKFRTKGFVAWLNEPMINENVELFSQMLLQEIIPRVESEYNVSKKREDRAIAGVSMGGLEALTVGLNNPRQFAWIGSFSAAFPNIHNMLPASTRDDYGLIWMACGVADHWVLRGNRRVVAALRKRDLSVTWLVTPGAHHWLVWQDDFVRFAPLLFQAK
jgi:enterochelin esterase family protein